MKKIFAFHLLNDYSGSPKVLSQLLRGWQKEDFDVHINTNCTQEGFLSDIENVSYHDNKYKFYKWIPLRVLVLMFSQLYILFSMFSKISKDDIVYINTILPFGAAILGRIKGANVIYHVHETSINPQIFKNFLLFWVRRCATKIIYVSNFLAKKEPLDIPSKVIWNSIPNDFIEKANTSNKIKNSRQKVLMIASLKRYKGVDEFVLISKACADIDFELVVNASEQDISDYFSKEQLPANLKIYPSQKDVHPFYATADVVMNLSRPEEWMETFGLTAVESMAYAIPVIVPPVGGIAEIVQEGISGFHLLGTDTKAIAQLLRKLRNDQDYNKKISRGAKSHASKFSEDYFLEQNIETLNY